MPEIQDQSNGLDQSSPPVIEQQTGRRQHSARQRPSPRLIVMIAGVIIGGIVGVRFYLHARAHESTDDAFIEGRIIPISPKVAGQVAKIHITDNQHVTVGEILVEIDPRDCAVRLAQAQAALEVVMARHKAAERNVELTSVTSGADVQQAAARVEAARSNLQTTRAQVMAAEAEATRDNADVQRYQQLYGEEVISRQQLDRAVATARMSTAQLAAARKRVAEAEAQLGEALGRLAEAHAAPQRVAVSQSAVETVRAEIEQARAAVQQAELELSYTTIVAPEAGRITRKSVEAGAYVQVGQALLAVVSDDLWIVANFKETQLTDMTPGQLVEISVDAYPHALFKGHVESIQAGTGAHFSLLPPENATGNYVKVVQRVPVKIVFDAPPDPQHALAPGMSVVPEVKIR
jgi:membrane fusion protein (multidrug efflux system)